MWAKSEGVLGPDPGQGDVREVVCLNRVFRWCLPAGGRAGAIEIEADARHVEILIHQLNLQNAKSLASHWRQEHEQRRWTYVASGQGTLLSDQCSCVRTSWLRKGLT